MSPILPLIALALPPAGPQPMTLKDIQGKPHTPLVLASGQRASAVFFLLADCPIARKFTPEIKRIIGDYRTKGVAFRIVHVDPSITPAAARAHAAEFGFTTCPILLDPTRKLVEHAYVSRAPTAAVFSPKGEVLYMGRIDDRFPTLGVQRREPTRRDLRIALDEVLNGKRVSRPRTSVVGCMLPRVL